jgi:hypothetical protein
MSLWPQDAFPPCVTIMPWSREAVAWPLQHTGGTAYTSLVSAAWPVANRAFFIPFTLLDTARFTHMFWMNGAAQAGNADVGVYSKDGTKLASTGSTATSGANAIQLIDVTDFTLFPGQYYLAMCGGNTGGSFIRGQSGNSNRSVRAGIAQQDVGAVTLPANFTLASVLSDYIPLFGIATRSI